MSEKNFATKAFKTEEEEKTEFLKQPSFQQSYITKQKINAVLSFFFMFCSKMFQIRFCSLIVPLNIYSHLSASSQFYPTHTTFSYSFIQYQGAYLFTILNVSRCPDEHFVFTLGYSNLQRACYSIIVYLSYKFQAIILF